MDLFNNELFWNVLSSALTFLAILVALTLPFIIERRDARNFKTLIIDEMKENYKKISKMTSDEDSALSDGTVIPANKMHDALVSNINLSVWVDYSTNWRD